MDKILVNNLCVQEILGVNGWERINLREIIINAMLFTDTSRAGKSDDNADCVDYSRVVKEIRALIENSCRFTVEALAEDIANQRLNKPGFIKVTIRVEKPGAVTGAESVGAEIERAN